jgi:GntR family transcriptional regulator
MRAFETQGVIRRRQGSGTFVVQPSGVIESGLEILESIETLAKRIGLPVSMGELEVFHQPANEEESQALHIPANSMVVHLSRVILAEERPVAYLIDTIPDDILKPEDLSESFTGSILDLFLQRGFPNVRSSRCEISAVSASHDVARFLGIQRGSVLLHFVNLLYDAEGRVVDYAFSYFLPGYFRFHVIRRVG